MRTRYALGVLVAATCCQCAAAQTEGPEVLEARSTALTFIQALLDGDAETARDLLDLSAEGNDRFARYLPMLCEMAHSENEVYAAAEAQFGEENEIPTEFTFTSILYTVVKNFEFFLVEVEDEQAFLREPVPGEEPYTMLNLNKVGGRWKIDAAGSFDFPLPETEDDLELLQKTTERFVRHMNQLRDEIPQSNSFEQYQQRAAEHFAELNREAQQASE